MTAQAPAKDPESGKRSLGRRDWATWPRYEAAVLGFRDPVAIHNRDSFIPAIRSEVEHEPRR